MHNASSDAASATSSGIIITSIATITTGSPFVAAVVTAVPLVLMAAMVALMRALLILFLKPSHFQVWLFCVAAEFSFSLLQSSSIVPKCSRTTVENVLHTMPISVEPETLSFKKIVINVSSVRPAENAC